MTTRASGGRNCACCKLDVQTRAEIARRAKNGDSIRSVSAWLISAGHPLGREAVQGHLRHSGIDPEQPETRDGLTRSVLCASIVASACKFHPAKLVEISTRLTDAGLSAEADVVLSGEPDSMRRALSSTADSPAGELLEARALASAVATVVGVKHPDVARELAIELSNLGADEVAATLLDLAEPKLLDVARTRDERVAQLRDAMSHPAADDRSHAVHRFQQINGPVSLDELHEAMAARTAT